MKDYLSPFVMAYFVWAIKVINMPTITGKLSVGNEQKPHVPQHSIVQLSYNIKGGPIKRYYSYQNSSL